jgi:hypothetical protein
MWGSLIYAQSVTVVMLPQLHNNTCEVCVITTVTILVKVDSFMAIYNNL